MLMWSLVPEMTALSASMLYSFRAISSYVSPCSVFCLISNVTPDAVTYWLAIICNDKHNNAHMSTHARMHTHTQTHSMIVLYTTIKMYIWACFTWCNSPTDWTSVATYVSSETAAFHNITAWISHTHTYCINVHVLTSLPHIHLSAYIHSRHIYEYTIYGYYCIQV